MSRQSSQSLSPQDTTTFADKGILCLKNFIPKRSIVAAQQAMNAELERLKLKTNGKFATSK